MAVMEAKGNGKQEFLIPRPKVSQTFIGPDYHGCINSGLQPCLSRLPDETFLVGPVILVRDIGVRLKFLMRPKRFNLQEGRREVRRFKSQPPANSVYRKLVHDVWKFNEEERQRIRKLQGRAMNGNMKAVLALSDHQ